MGRPEQRKRDTKKAAASCQKLDKFLTVKKSKLDVPNPETEENKPSASFHSSNQSDNDTNREQLMDSSSSDNVSSLLHKPNEISEEPLSDMLSFNDIGLLINEAMTVSEIENVLLD